MGKAQAKPARCLAPLTTPNPALSTPPSTHLGKVQKGAWVRLDIRDVVAGEHHVKAVPPLLAHQGKEGVETLRGVAGDQPHAHAAGPKEGQQVQQARLRLQRGAGLRKGEQRRGGRAQPACPSACLPGLQFRTTGCGHGALPPPNNQTTTLLPAPKHAPANTKPTCASSSRIASMLRLMRSPSSQDSMTCAGKPFSHGTGEGRRMCAATASLSYFLRLLP